MAGAIVFQSGDSSARTEATTGTDGRFTLNGVVARPTFLFVRKPGYRFAGVAIAAEAADLTLAIHKVDEPPRLVRKTLPPPLPHPEEVALARRLLDPYAERVLKQGGEAEKVRTLEALARIEPERVLELIQKKAFNVPFLNAMIGLRVASGMMEESIDEALAVLEGLEQPEAKAMGFIDASKKLGTQNRTRALEVLDRALLNARVAKEPDGIKLLLMGQVAEQFLDLGQAERGRALLREGEALAKQLPRAGWVGYARAPSPKSWCRSMSRPRWHSPRTSPTVVNPTGITATSLMSSRAAIRPNPSAYWRWSRIDCSVTSMRCGSSIAWPRSTSPVPAGLRNRSATIASRGTPSG